MTPPSKRSTPTLWSLCLVKTKLTRAQEQALHPLPQVLLSPEARTTIERETKDSPHAETGGILVGHIDPPLTLRITAASGPGPNAQRTPTYFLRDTAFCAGFLRERYEESGADYLGDWHSHLRGVASDRLSPGDFLTLLQTIRDPDYSDLPGFAKILAVLDSQGRTARFHSPKTNLESKVELKGFVATREFILEVPLNGNSELGDEAHAP